MRKSQSLFYLTTALHVSGVTYRKPTTTDTTINYLSNHPTEHKIAAY